MICWAQKAGKKNYQNSKRPSTISCFHVLNSFNISQNIYYSQEELNDVGLEILEHFEL